MCRLLETIKVENGKLFNLSYHQQRFNRARKELFPDASEISLAERIQVPADCHQGLFRCRILYSREIEKIEFIPQQKRSFRSLKLVEGHEIDYHLKYAQRDELNQLLAQAAGADEIIIVKNGELTDCSIGNLVFFDGSNWFTPQNPLLKGTQRQRLLDEGKIYERIIKKEELRHYQRVGIINAFFDFDSLPTVKISNILE